MSEMPDRVWLSAPGMCAWEGTVPPTPSGVWLANPGRDKPYGYTRDDLYTAVCAERDALKARAEAAEAEVERLREAGDEMAESVEHGFISDGLEIWDNTRAALQETKP